MIVGVGRRPGVVDGQGADELVVEHERANERGLQRRMDIHQSRGFQVGVWTSVDQRPPVARDPSDQPLSVANGELLDDLGVGPGGETAALCANLVDSQKQRTAGKGHEVAQLGGDEGHRVGDTQTAAHRLRDLIQRVDFAVCERDVVKNAGRAGERCRFRTQRG